MASKNFSPRSDNRPVTFSSTIVLGGAPLGSQAADKLKARP